jgi:hypothetical protein
MLKNPEMANEVDAKLRELLLTKPVEEPDDEVSELEEEVEA